MSVLRTGVYANPDTPLWEDAGGLVRMTSASITALSDGPLGALGSQKFYDVVPPPEFVGKVCRISVSARIVGIAVETGTYACVMAGLQGYSVPPGGSSPTLITYGLQTLTTNNTANGDLWFSSSIDIVPTGDADLIGFYVYNRSGAGVVIASIEVQVLSCSISLIDTTPIYTQDICVPSL